MTRVPAGAYPREDGVPRLLRSVVAYVDLLGTSVHASDENAQVTLQRLDAALRRARRQSDIDDGLSWFHTSWFSDNLSICAPLPHPNHVGDRSFEESSLGFVLVTLMWLQFCLAIEGIVLRGGVTVGKHFADNEVNFGPALVRAVALEQGAKPPRVVLDDAVLAVVDDHFKDHFSLTENPFHRELMRAPDGHVFISYLGAVFEADDMAEAHEMLVLHRAALAEMLNAHQHGTVDVVDKYEWLVSYHNSFCNLFFPEWPNVLMPPSDARFTAYAPSSL